VDPAVVSDEAQLLELVHEQIDARASGANHFRQRLLRNTGKGTVSRAWRAIAGEQQQGACQAFLGGVEELIYGQPVPPGETLALPKNFPQRLAHLQF
jgi:hypothetical protein